MKLGLAMGLLVPGMGDPATLAIEAEQLGYDSVWFGEIYGSDCFTPLTWIGSRTERIKLGTSIMQISGRTPANAAMTAVTLDMLSQGRLMLGIGVSGPQVVEGWYGQPYPRPLARTREWIELFRKILAREGPVEFEGDHYQIPYTPREGATGLGPILEGTGLGKPIKLMLPPLRPDIPLYLGAEGPKNVALAAELCDGWLPMFISPHRLGLYDDALSSAGPDFDIAAMVQMSVHDDLERAFAPIKQTVGWYVGGMGAKDVNFHKNHVSRLGFEEEAEHIQDLFLAGKREEAYAAVPDQLVDEIALCGPPDRIRDRLQAWKESRVSTLVISTYSVDHMRLIAEGMA
ncbi:LLM class F420-dependent oxidoreductase [Myxococcota bacterium]|nr:LLM class F420-dependent oxidoreductase [Myxococcota bacterium]